MENNIVPLKKGIVVDTSALIKYPDIVDRVPGAVFIPLTVIKQLDGLKNNSDINVSKQARAASFFIERAIKEKRVAILTKFDRVDGLDNESDNRIVGAAVHLKNSNPNMQVSLLATDRNMRITAASFGISGLNVGRDNTRKNYVWNLCWSAWFGVFAAVIVSVVIFLGIIIADPVMRVIAFFAGASVMGLLYFISTIVKRNHNVDLSPLAYLGDKPYDDDKFLDLGPGAATLPCNNPALYDALYGSHDRE